MVLKRIITSQPTRITTVQMTRRPIRPISEPGVFTKPRVVSLGEKIDDAVYMGIVIGLSLILGSFFQEK